MLCKHWKLWVPGQVGNTSGTSVCAAPASDVEPLFVCGGFRNRGAEVGPDFDSGKPPQFPVSKHLVKGPPA